MAFEDRGSNVTIDLLENATTTDTGSWFRLPKDKVFSVRGITTATVVIEYKVHDSDTAATLNTFTADGYIVNNDPLGYVRARVSAYTSGTISVSCSVTDPWDAA